MDTLQLINVNLSIVGIYLHHVISLLEWKWRVQYREVRVRPRYITSHSLEKESVTSLLHCRLRFCHLYYVGTT